MNINDLSNNINGSFNKSEVSNSGTKIDDTDRPKAPKHSEKDTISLENYSFRSDDLQFAKVELQKLEKVNSEKFSDLKTKIAEYNKAKQESPESAKQTEIGQLINNTSVWENIATKILQ